MREFNSDSEDDGTTSGAAGELEQNTSKKCEEAYCDVNEIIM